MQSVRLVLSQFSSCYTKLETRSSQCNFSTIRYEHRCKRLNRRGSCRAVSDSIGSKQLAGKVSGLSNSAHGHVGLQTVARGMNF